jgi:hypothetical protein
MPKAMPRWLGVVLAVAILPPTVLPAQSPATLEVGCDECRISLDTVAMLGEREGPGMLSGEFPYVHQDLTGQTFMFSHPSPVIQVFDPEYTFRHTIGREGEGPGELRWPQALYVDQSGEVTVLDAMLGRISTFSHEGRVLRTTPLRELSPGFDLAPLPGDSLLITGYGFSPERFGSALHVVGPDGVVARSFGDPDYAITSRNPHALMRHMTVAPDRRIWLVPMDRYRIEMWTLSGELQEVYEGGTEDFDHSGHLSPGGPSPPTPTMSSIHLDPEGLLWIAAHVPGDRWEDGVEPSTGEPGAWDVIDEAVWRETLIEVIDPARGMVLASIRLQGRHTRFFGDRRIGRVVADLENAEAAVMVLQLELEGR